MTTTRSSALRRYPALGYLAGVGALALLLPSGLTVPQSGPPTLAEHAPVPGRGTGPGDQGELGGGDSDGIGGFGPGNGGAGPGGSLPPEIIEVVEGGGAGGAKPGTKRCVGSPPRQTEDPLSPPCIAFFEGDNFGATAKGVTRDRVVVVAELENLSERTNPNAGKVIDCATPVTDQDATVDVLCKAFMKFFNQRYQTYGRTVHLYNGHNVGLTTLDERYQPFAYVNQTASGGGKDKGVVSVGYYSNGRNGFQQQAPYQIGFRPDLEDQGAIVAGYVCDKLAGRPARYAGDAALRTQTRKFAYWTGFNAFSGYDEAVMAALKSRCGIEVHREVDVRDATIAARMKAGGITTVFIAGQSTPPVMTRQATKANFFPEWVVPGSNSMRDISVNFFARLTDPVQFVNAFGITVDYRRPRLDEQTWYRAYKEGCPSCPEITAADGGSAFVGAVTYDAIAMLFYGIQAAGPRLNAENLDRGMHAIEQLPSQDPFRPAAYFGPGNYTFVKDATAMWWDPAGQPPGGSEVGCYRLAHGGLRFRSHDWRPGDDDVKADGPCQGDVVRG